jgi:hypothetical protein
VRRGISGDRAGLIVRELVDFRPPRRAAELAQAARISESYTSRLLDTLSEEALIVREHRVITDVNWPDLLRARAATYQLMKTNRIIPAVARRGLNATLDVLRADPERRNQPHILMTGTMAAGHYAPLVVGGTLQLYIPPVAEEHLSQLMKDLRLAPVPTGANPVVQLIRPNARGPLLRPGPAVDGIETVGMSQLVLDCLSGPGRMPAAGEELLSWMQNHEDEWRRPGPLAPGNRLE